jgi:hypothetical protein
MRDIIIDAIFLAFISAFCFTAGLRLLLAKRPFIVGYRRWGILCITPLMVNSVTTLWRGYPWEGEGRLYAIVIMCGIAIILGLILCVPGGGFVIGVTGATLRDALRQAFGGLGLSYEESAKGFRLPALNNELIVRSGPIAGMFSVHLKRFGGRRAFRELAPEIKDFFKTAPVRINKRAGYALVVIGVAFLLFESLLTYKRLSLRAKMRALDEEYTQFSKPSEK